MDIEELASLRVRKESGAVLKCGCCRLTGQLGTRLARAPSGQFGGRGRCIAGCAAGTAPSGNAAILQAERGPGRRTGRTDACSGSGPEG